MKKIVLCLAAAGVAIVSVMVPSSAPAQFATSIIAYDRGTGYSPNFTNAAAALGAPASGSGITPFAPPFSTSQIVSIGAGGSLTLQFTAPIVNNPADPFGIDFLIFGNSFFVVTGGSGSSAQTSGAIFTSSVSTRVEVSSDGVEWFTLDPTLAPTVGTLFPTDGLGNPQLPVNPSLRNTDFAGLTLAGIRGLYNGSAGGAGFDLGWARDNGGSPVDLASASYVRIDVLSGRTQIDALSAVVPEPSAAALLLLGLAALAVKARRGRARNPLKG